LVTHRLQRLAAKEFADQFRELFAVLGGVYVANPPLRSLHSQASLNKLKLEQFHRLSSAELIESLRPGRPGALKVRPDGTMLDGHHRIIVLRERGVAIDELPREVLPHASED